MDFGLNSMNRTLINQALLRTEAGTDRPYASRDTGAFNAILANKAATDTAEISANSGNAVWGRMANTVLGNDLVSFISGRINNCSMKEFTDYYEEGLKAKGLSGTDYAALVRGAKSFSDVFSDYKVTTKVGNANINSGYWGRNDFPFNKYFEKDFPVDGLNNWKPKGPDVAMDSSVSQRRMESVGPGQIAIVVPEKLQEKMDADPAYAEEIYAKVAKWKADYDRWDNATGAALGMNVAECQYSKSYCLILDEEGEVKQSCVFSSGRLIGPTKEEIEQFKKEQKEKWEREDYYRQLVKDSALKRYEAQQDFLASLDEETIRNSPKLAVAAFNSQVTAILMSMMR